MRGDYVLERGAPLAAVNSLSSAFDTPHLISNKYAILIRAERRRKSLEAVGYAPIVGVQPWSSRQTAQEIKMIPFFFPISRLVALEHQIASK